MLSFLPGPLLLVINLLLVSVNTCIFSLPILVMSIVRLIFPVRAVHRGIEKANNAIYRQWSGVNGLIIGLTNRIHWRVSGVENLCIKDSCVLICNHLSWADIVVLCHVMRSHLPIPKFFLKHSLIYIPVVGLVCLGLGMPFMRRYSREQLMKNPALKTKDLATTRRACRRLVLAPSTLVNFCEGTRFTPAKAKAARSPYRHLMPPKAAGLGFAMGQIGRDIDTIVNVTIAYPQNRVKPFIALLKGDMHEVYFHVETIPVTQELSGDYVKDKQFKHFFTMWLRDIWQKKDERLATEVYAHESVGLAGPTVSDITPEETPAPHAHEPEGAPTADPAENKSR